MTTSTLGNDKLQVDKATNKFIEKIQGDRNDVTQSFRAQCDALARELEVALLRVCGEVARTLAEKERELSGIFEELQNTLVGLEQPALALRRVQIEETQHDIAQLLEDFEHTLQCAEQVRHDQAVKLIGTSMESTMDIRRGVPSEVMQILADESRKISSAILRNREAYANVYAQLRVKALDLDKLIGQNWSTVEHTWRVLNYKHSIEKFKLALASATYRNPPARVAAFEALRAEQRTHHTHMLDQLHSVFRLTPPTQLNPTSVEEWNTSLRAVLAQAAQDHRHSTQTLRALEDIMHTSCAELVAKLRDDLREFRVVDDRDMAAILTECRALLDARGRESLTLLAHVEIVLDAHTSSVTRACAALCHYLTRVAALLEIQEREAKVMRLTYQEKLLQLHNEFAAANQAQEEKLQQTISIMQGEIDDEELYRLLQKALETLRVIEEGYRNFCAAGVALSVDYPNDTKAMLTQQQEAVCFIFGLTTDKEAWRASKKPPTPIPPKDEQKESENKEVTEEEPSAVAEKKPTKKRGPKRDARSTSPNSRPSSSMRPTTSPSVKAIPSRSTSSIISPAQPAQATQPTQPARRRSPQRRKRDAEKEETKEDKEEAPVPAPPLPEIVEVEKEPEEDVDVVTTPFSKYYILTNRPSLLHPEDPPASIPAQVPTPEPIPASAQAPVSAATTLPLPAHNSSPNNSNRMATATRLAAGLQHSAVRRARPTSSRAGAAGLLAMAAAASAPSAMPPRTQAQEISDEIDKIKGELLAKGTLGVPLDPDGTPCLEMHAVPEALILYLEHSVRRSVVNHIENLFKTLLHAAIEEGKNSKKSFTSDLEERLRMHRPRSGHIELEIYHQRAGDLHAHRVRFDRHVQSVTERFNQECRSISASTKEIQNSLEEYSKAQVGKVVAMGNANNTLTLQVLLREARDAHKSVVELVNGKIAELRARGTKMGQSVADENVKYIENLKKEGGGSSASEIAHINSHLILLNQSVDAKCLQLAAYTDTVAQALMRGAAAALQSVEAAHGAHHEDLTFLEGVNFRSGNFASKIRAEIARCERQHVAIASLIERLVAPSASELLPLVDAIRKAVFNRATYLEVLQSAITLTPSLLGPEITPLPPIPGLAFLSESDFPGTESGGEEDDEDDREKDDKEKMRGRGGERKGKPAQPGGQTTSRKTQGGAERAEPAENEEDEKEKSAGARRSKKTSKFPTSSSPTPLPPLAPGSAPNSAARTTRRMPAKLERTFPFTQAVTRIIRQCRKDAQQLCEEYYRTKGDRPVTRPNRIPSSLPLLLQSLEEGYAQHEQSTAAHRAVSVKQFHAQLVTACAHLCAVPRGIFQAMTGAILAQCRAQQEQMEVDFSRKKSAWKLEREKLHNAIRPQMAHPNYHPQLESSAAQAQYEHATNATAINAHCDAVKRKQDEHAARMCAELESTGGALFKLLDEFVLPQDLVPGGVDEAEVAYTSMQQVLRRMQSLNTKPPAAPEVPAVATLASSNARDSAASLPDAPATNTNAETEKEKVDKSDKTDKSALKGKVKDPKSDAPRKARTGLRVREESADQSAGDGMRPFPKQAFAPLAPLPTPVKDPPLPAVAPPAQETKRKAGKGNNVAASTPAPPAPTPAPPPVSHVHYATPAHEAVASARTQAYTQYAQHYTKALSDAELARSVLLDEEQRDFEYLTQALITLLKQHRM